LQKHPADKSKLGEYRRCDKLCFAGDQIDCEGGSPHDHCNKPHGAEPSKRRSTNKHFGAWRRRSVLIGASDAVDALAPSEG
jgi:hypothetical protein